MGWFSRFTPTRTMVERCPKCGARVPPSCRSVVVEVELAAHCMARLGDPAHCCCRDWRVDGGCVTILRSCVTCGRPSPRATAPSTSRSPGPRASAGSAWASRAGPGRPCAEVSSTVTRASATSVTGSGPRRLTISSRSLLAGPMTSATWRAATAPAMSASTVTGVGAWPGGDRAQRAGGEPVMGGALIDAQPNRGSSFDRGSGSGFCGDDGLPDWIEASPELTLFVVVALGLKSGALNLALGVRRAVDGRSKPRRSRTRRPPGSPQDQPVENECCDSEREAHAHNEDNASRTGSGMLHRWDRTTRVSSSSRSPASRPPRNPRTRWGAGAPR